MAANSILKLKVDNTEYDANIKKAAEGIQHLAKRMHDAQGDFEGLDKASLDFIKDLQYMTTASKTASGQYRELENAYKNLAATYEGLNAFEKEGDAGKALAEQLEILKKRTLDMKANMDAASQSLQTNATAGQEDSSALSKLAEKFTLNIDALKLFDLGLKAAGVALDVAKDAFFSSETNVDDWGRTVQSAESVYQSFLVSLNTGDFSSFLNNIGQVTQAAREAYNALDELGTRMTIINPERAKLQARQQELRADIRRNGADSEVGKAALAELKKIEPLLSKSFKTESRMNYDAFEKLVRERLAEGGINLNQKSFREFMKTFSSDAAFQQLRNNARGSITTEMTGNAYNPNATMTRRTVDTRNIEQKLLDLFTDEWRQANSGYLAASYQAQGSAASNALGNARYMKTGSAGRTGSGGKGGKTGNTDDFTEIVGLIGNAQERVNDLQKQISESWDEGEIARLTDDLKDAEAELQRLKDIGKGPDLDKLFPDMSKANFNTGYAGSAQAKYDSARSDLALGPMNLDAVNTYIGSIKGMLKDANLGDELYTSMTEKLKDATTVSTLLQEMMERGLAGADLERTAQALKEKMLSPEGIDQTAIQSFLEDLNKQIEEAGGVGLKLNTDTGAVTDDKGKGKDDGEELKKFNEGVGKLTGGLSSVTSGLKAVGVEIPKEVDQVIGVVNGISQIISGVGTIISIFGTTAITANTTAVGLNTAAIGGLIAAIEFNTASNFIPFFANGGIVPHAANGYFVGGNIFSGDNTPIMANAGELVLNKAQQGNLASMLTDEERGGGNAQPYLDGEKIYLGLQAYMRRSGLGEIVTSER